MGYELAQLQNEHLCSTCTDFGPTYLVMSLCEMQQYLAKVVSVAVAASPGRPFHIDVAAALTGPSNLTETIEVECMPTPTPGSLVTGSVEKD